MPDLEMFLLAIVQAIILLALAPLMTGISRMMRARMHSRRGPGVLQDYRDIAKLFKRQDVAPNSSGLVFQAAPFIIIGTMLVLAMALPVLTRASPMGVLADMIATYGEDSIFVKMAATMFGSTETTFYVIAVYFGAVGVKKVRHAVSVGLIADLVGACAAVEVCWWLFG